MQGLEAARRAGWARAYAAEREAARLRGLLAGVLVASLDAAHDFPGTSAALDVARLGWRRYRRDLMEVGAEWERWSVEAREAFMTAQKEGMSLLRDAGWSQPLCAGCHVGVDSYFDGQKVDHSTCHEWLEEQADQPTRGTL